MVRKLSLWGSLGDDDRAAILALPFTRRKLDPGQYIVWDGETPRNSCMLIDGYAFRHKIAGSGRRQILSIHIRGDLVDLQNSLLGVADHNLQMFTAGEIAMIAVEDMREIAFSRPNVGMAMWYETLVEVRSSVNGCSTSAAATRAPGSRICCANSRSGSKWPSSAARAAMNCP